MKNKVFILLLSLLCVSAYAQSKLPVFVTDSLDTYVNRAMKQWQIPGVAVGIVKDGKAVLLKGYGVREAGKPEKVDVNTLFMIGSNTKAFTATALAILDAEKKLSLNDPVQKWLPDFKLYDPWVAKEAMIADLLCHRLGFETFQGDFMFFDSDLNTQEMMERFGKLKPMYGFRTKWGYTNAAFMVAGQIFPKATGKTWGDYLAEGIFKPLGMNSTLALSSAIASASNKAAAHTSMGGPLRKIAYGQLDALSPAGSISSSVSDMSRWVMALLDTGKLDGKRVMPAEAILETRVPRTIMGNGWHMFNKKLFELYGLGWDIHDYEGRKFVGHTGGVNGFVTSVAMIPEERLGIIVLTNTDSNGFFEALRNEIQDAFLGLPYRNYDGIYYKHTTARTAREELLIKQQRDTIATKPRTDLPLPAFAGTYKHELYGNMTMTLEGNKLVARFEHHKGRFANVEALGKNRFLATFNEALYGTKVWPFTIEGGKVKSVKVTVSDFVEFTPYEFVKVK
ncbi:MAG TPA: serine hydrolase [Cyclobacteriaceae bacterium]|nr:serine hydrolase [Cyclobacteriaceae bacterium]